MAIKNKKIMTIIIIVLVFAIWAGCALYRTINCNPDWFEDKEQASDKEEHEKEEISTTDKFEFEYALAWSKAGDNWVCVNIDGFAEIVLDPQYTEVTEFCNSRFAMVKDMNGVKTLIDRAGDFRLCEYSYVCDEILTNDFHANLVVATQKMEVDGKEVVGYGLINDDLNWCKAPSPENDYLKDFTRGIDGGVLTTEKGDKLYFKTLDVVVEDVDEFLFYDETTAMFRRGTTIYLIDKSGEHERVSMEGIAKCGEWTEGVIYCELTNGKRVFNDINGKELLDVSDMKITNLPRFINGYAGVVFDTEDGEKYTVIDLDGKKLFEPKDGNMCDTLTEKVFRVKDDDGMKVIDEKGKTLFKVDKSITNFTNGYAIKDSNVYVRTDGTELKLTKNKETK